MARVRLLIERNVRVPMRDGVTLAAEIYRLDTRQPLPVILERTPYDRRWMPPGDPVNGLALAEAGYVVVMQDCRGRFDSEGDFRPFLSEAADGEDAIAWCATQPWSDGRVGMMGGSYVGATQWLAAGTGTPALRAIAPYVTASDYHEGWVYQGGAFQLGFSLYWSLNSLALPRLLSRQAAGERLDAEIAAARAAIEDIERLYRRRPLRGIDLLDRFAPWYDEWLGHPERDGFWRSIAPQERYRTTTTPALNIGGWYDIFVEGTLRNFAGMRAGAPDERARRGQQLIVGPWSHSLANGVFPERHFGMLSGLPVQDPTTLHRRFYDRWLRGAPGDGDPEAPVRLFVMGANEWRDESEWPPADAEVQAWHLRGDGPANGAAGAGRLSREPAAHEAADAITADPRDPVPSVGGPTLNRGGRSGWSSGPWDQRAVEARSDVLCYTSDPLARPLDVVGTVEAVLHVSTATPDADIAAKLVDVHPDGRAEVLTDGILRLRYRRSLAEPEPMEPGRVEEVRVLVGSTANRFLVGHRIRLDVAGSNFPRFDVNTNTGGVIASEAADQAQPTITRVFHDSTRPSRLLLPVVERA